jgi:hypothetical protein
LKFDDLLTTYLFQRCIEHIICFLVYCSLVAFCISIYQQHILHARITAGALPYFHDAKCDIVSHYAFTGEWPKFMPHVVTSETLASNPYLIEYGGSKNQGAEPRFGRNHQLVHRSVGLVMEAYIVDGGYNLKLRASKWPEVDGRWITLRPAVIDQYRTGPVAWICGNQTLTPGWVVQGEDQTSLRADYLPAVLRPLRQSR